MLLKVNRKICNLPLILLVLVILKMHIDPRYNRYQREEAKIQAWVNLQNAKAEAQSRKLEVLNV